MVRMGTLKTEMQVNEESGSGATRMAYWAAAVDMAKDHPFGAGPLVLTIFSSLYPAKYNYGTKSKSLSPFYVV